MPRNKVVTEFWSLPQKEHRNFMDVGRASSESFRGDELLNLNPSYNQGIQEGFKQNAWNTSLGRPGVGFAVEVPSFNGVFLQCP
jgi:hypothetical protein